MLVYISLLRGINVGGNKVIKMADLRTLYESLGFAQVQTLLQSGNVVFSSDLTDADDIAKRIEASIEAQFGFHSTLFVLTVEDLIAVHDQNPFAAQSDVDPSKLLVTFLHAPLSETVIAQYHAKHDGPEIVKSVGKALYIYFPDGMGRSSIDRNRKLPQIVGTGRNWNTVTKLRDMVLKAVGEG
ncbi:MAG: DUF1697 domain-containing protein [Chloroflexota bacterium]|nr:DUF1697 domain-containing protein [Chloroflexota bacterium]